MDRERPEEGGGGIVIIEHPCLPMWQERIDEAERRGAFSREDDQFAASWDTCAVGEAAWRGYQIEKLRVGGFQPPVDPELYELGSTFSQVVTMNYRNFREARRILNKITHRLEV